MGVPRGEGWRGLQGRAGGSSSHWQQLHRQGLLAHTTARQPFSVPQSACASQLHLCAHSTAPRNHTMSAGSCQHPKMLTSCTSASSLTESTSFSREMTAAKSASSSSCTGMRHIAAGVVQTAACTTSKPAAPIPRPPKLASDPLPHRRAGVALAAGLRCIILHI